MLKIQIRNNVFETNSSMTHSLTICTKDEYNAFDRGELAYIGDAWGTFPLEWKDKEFVPMDELIEWVHKQEAGEYAGYDSDEIICDACIYTELTQYIERNEEMEFYEDEFTTPSGDQMVAFGVYGYD